MIISPPCSHPSYISVTKPVIPAGIAGIQTTWMYLSLPSMALDTRFPAGMTNSYLIVYYDERHSLVLNFYIF